MGEPDWKRRIGLADLDGTVLEVEHDDGHGWVRASCGAFTLSAMDPEPAALRQLSAAALDLAERMEGEDGGA